MAVLMFTLHISSTINLPSKKKTKGHQHNSGWTEGEKPYTLGVHKLTFCCWVEHALLSVGRHCLCEECVNQNKT